MLDDVIGIGFLLMQFGVCVYMLAAAMKELTFAQNCAHKRRLEIMDRANGVETPPSTVPERDDDPPPT